MPDNESKFPVICSLCNGEGKVVVEGDIANCFACDGNGFVYVEVKVIESPGESA